MMMTYITLINLRNIIFEHSQILLLYQSVLSAQNIVNTLCEESVCSITALIGKFMFTLLTFVRPTKSITSAYLFAN